MSKITESAKGEQCTIRLPGICNHNPETTVFAHINGVRFGHGVGIKTKFGAYSCSACHDAVDGRYKNAKFYSEWSETSLKKAHLEGVIETLIRLEEKGLVKLS